ncbi:cache domain-containing protein, partial [Cucumibacter marinus]
MNILKRFKLSKALPAIMISGGLMMGAGVGFASYQIAADALMEQTRVKLNAIASSRASQIKDYVQSVKTDLLTQSESNGVSQAIQGLDAAWGNLAQTGDPFTILDAAYGSGNPNPLGERDKLIAADTNSRYDRIHGRFHGFFRKLLQRNGYYDVFLFNPKGDLIYSVAKEADFATRFSEDGGQWADTDLGRAFREAATLPNGEVAYFDMAAYAPSNGAPASFMSAPVYDDADTLLGVIAYQISINEANSVTSDRVGLGQTGETVIVGRDLTMRNDSELSGADDTLTTRVDSPLVQAAIDGEAGFGQINGYRGIPLFAAATPMSFEGVDWAIVTVQARDEALGPLVDMRNLIFAIGGLMILSAAIVSILIARMITKPVTRLTGVMGTLAKGEYDVEIEGADGRDEIADMARAVEVFRANGIKVAEMTEEEAARIERNRVERARMMSELQGAFGEVVDAAVAGNFGKRVDAKFPDEELNQLAGSVNNLVSTVERGLDETADVLSALAQTDLTQRVEGE